MTGERSKLAWFRGYTQPQSEVNGARISRFIEDNVGETFVGEVTGTDRAGYQPVGSVPVSVTP